MTEKTWRGFKKHKGEATAFANSLKRAGYRNVKVKMFRHDRSRRVLGWDIVGDNPKR